MKRLTVLVEIMLLVICTRGVFASEFLFTKVIDGIPYAIITQGETLQRTQAALLHSFLIGPKYQSGKSIIVDTAHPEINKKLGLYWEPQDYRLWPIIGSEGFMSYMVGYKPGDCFTMQVVTEDGSGGQRKITVEKVMYSVWGRESAVVLKCKPVILDSTWVYKKHRMFYCPYITHPRLSWERGAPRNPIDTSLPDRVRLKVDSLSNAFFPPKAVYEGTRITVQPMRFYQKGKEQIYYAAVFSYGEKGVTGVLYLLDDSGEVIQKLDNRGFNGINGITDVNRDGTHELVLFVGSGYGGGVEIYVLEWNKEEESARLTSATYIGTVFD